MVGFIERIANRLKLPEWVVGLALVFAVDAVLAGVIVLGVKGVTGNGSNSSKAWTLKELEDRFLLKSMDSIEPFMGKASSFVVERNGTLQSLRYENMTVIENGQQVTRAIGFYGSGGRCVIVGFYVTP